MVKKSKRNKTIKKQKGGTPIENIEWWYLRLFVHLPPTGHGLESETQGVGCTFSSFSSRRVVYRGWKSSFETFERRPSYYNRVMCLLKGLERLKSFSSSERPKTSLEVITHHLCSILGKIRTEGTWLMHGDRMEKTTLPCYFLSRTSRQIGRFVCSLKPLKVGLKNLLAKKSGRKTLSDATNSLLPCNISLIWYGEILLFGSGGLGM